jgi:hypothetical protein
MLNPDTDPFSFYVTENSDKCIFFDPKMLCISYEASSLHAPLQSASKHESLIFSPFLDFLHF